MKRIHFFAESIIAVLLCMFIMCEADATYISSFGDELSYPASISEANIIEGSANTFLIDENNALWAWGVYCRGAQKLEKDYPTPTKIMENVVSVSVSDKSVAVIKEDGSLWTWGLGTVGRPSEYPFTDEWVPKKLMDHVIYAKLYGNGGVAITEDHTLWRWPADSRVNSYRPEPAAIMEDVAKVAVSEYGGVTCALKQDGTVWTSGDNRNGSLGNGSLEYGTYEWTKILEDVTDIAVGQENGAAIQSDGTLWLWGDNRWGQVGNGTRDNQPTPVKVLDDVAAVGMDLSKTLAITSDHSLYVWGNVSDIAPAEFQQPGNFSFTTPTKIMDNVAAAMTSPHYHAVIKTDGTLWGWYYAGDSKLTLGTGKDEAAHTPVKLMDDVAYCTNGAIYSDCNYSLVIKNDGSVWVWGCNDYSNAGLGFGVGENLEVGFEQHFYQQTPVQLPALAARVEADVPKAAKPVYAESKIRINGKETTISTFMINDYNYFKLRDLALLLSGTDKQFEVSWDDAEDRISLTTGTAYTKTGNEFNTSSSYQKAELTNADIFIDGKKASLSGYEIDNSNFFRLRDLGEALDFEVDWDNHSQTVIITTN